MNRLDHKKKMIEYKGGECCICGYNKCLNALHFHHVDPSEKSFNLADSHTKDWEVVEEELDKCILLCCIHHAEIHSNLLHYNRDDMID